MLIGTGDTAKTTQQYLDGTEVSEPLSGEEGAPRSPSSSPSPTRPTSEEWFGSYCTEGGRGEEMLEQPCKMFLFTFARRNIRWC